MFNPYRYSNKPTVDPNKRLNITTVLRAVKLELLNMYHGFGKNFRIKHPYDAETIKHQINDNFHQFNCLMVPQHDSVLKVDYIKSNLRGFVFYFVCNRCEGRVKHLYQAEQGGQLACRACHRLWYKKKSQKGTELRRLLKNPQVLVTYLQSMPRFREKAQEVLDLLSQYLRKELQNDNSKPTYQ